MGDQVAAEHYLGPITLLTGFALEIYLKAVLLSEGRTVVELKDNFGHDIWKMWINDDCQRVRVHADHIVSSCYEDLRHSFDEPHNRDPRSRDYIPNIVRSVPEPGSLEATINELSALHTNSMRYPLRYPEKSYQVPDPMLVIAVFERLVRSELLRSKSD